MIAHALIDPDFAKDQLDRFLRERYQHPNGNLPAYEFNFADATAWMAHFAAEMLAIAVELASHDPVYDDIARRFFEHYLAIVTAINSLDVTGRSPLPRRQVTLCSRHGLAASHSLLRVFRRRHRQRRGTPDRLVDPRGLPTRRARPPAVSPNRGSGARLGS